jgi:hypothetical protein
MHQGDSKDGGQFRWSKASKACTGEVARDVLQHAYFQSAEAFGDIPADKAFRPVAAQCKREACGIILRDNTGATSHKILTEVFGTKGADGKKVLGKHPEDNEENRERVLDYAEFLATKPDGWTFAARRFVDAHAKSASDRVYERALRYSRPHVPDFDGPGKFFDADGMCVEGHTDGSVTVRNARPEDLARFRLPHALDTKRLFGDTGDARAPFDIEYLAIDPTTLRPMLVIDKTNATDDEHPKKAAFKAFVEASPDPEAMRETLRFAQVLNPYTDGPLHFVTMVWDALVGNYTSARYHVLQPPIDGEHRASGFLKTAFTGLLDATFGEYAAVISDENLAGKVDPRKNQQWDTFQGKRILYVEESKAPPHPATVGKILTMNADRPRMQCKKMHKDQIEMPLSIGAIVVGGNYVAPTLTERAGMPRRAVFHPLRFLPLPPDTWREFHSGGRDAVTDTTYQRLMALVKDNALFIEAKTPGADARRRMGAALLELACFVGRGRGWATAARELPPAMVEAAKHDGVADAPAVAAGGAAAAATGDDVAMPDAHLPGAPDTNAAGFIANCKAAHARAYVVTGDKNDYVKAADYMSVVLEDAYGKALSDAWLSANTAKNLFETITQLGAFAGNQAPTFEKEHRMAGGGKIYGVICGVKRTEA